MNKIILISSSIIFLIFSILTYLGISSLQKDSFKEKLLAVTEEKTELSDQIAEIKTVKDDNGYTPVDVVKYFVLEIKNGSTDAAKLYISEELQASDVLEMLGVSKNDTGLALVESDYTSEGQTATVSSKIVINSEEVSKTFSLSKVEFNWKITGIKGE